VAALAMVTVGLLGWNIGLQVQVSNAANRLPSTFAYMPIERWTELVLVNSNTSIAYNSSSNIVFPNSQLVVALRGETYVSGNSTAQILVVATFDIPEILPPETVYSFNVSLPLSVLHNIVFDTGVVIPMVFAGSVDVGAFSAESFMSTPFPNVVHVQTKLPASITTPQIFSSAAVVIPIGDYYPLAITN
jgi:hypothetical protein